MADGLRRLVLLLLVALGTAALPCSPARAQGTAAPIPGAAPAGEGALTETLAQDEALDRLLEVLSDDAARAALIARLEDAQAGTESPPAEAAPTIGFAQGLAETTTALAAEIAAEALRLGTELARLGDLAQRLREAAVERDDEIWPLLATILSTIAASLTFGLAARSLARRLRPRRATWLARVWAALLTLGAHLAALGLAWALGYVLATLAFGERGTASAAQALYLNAFAAYGLVRLLLRAFADPDAGEEPSLSPVDPRAQRTIYRALAAVAGVVMQGFMFVVPLVHLWAGFAAARPVRTVVATLAALVGLWSIRAIARALDRARPERRAEPAPPHLPPEFIGPPEPPASATMAEGLGSAWRGLWPPLAVAYVAYAWFMAVTRPALATEVVLGGTAMTAVALALVILALHVLRRAHAFKAPIPARAALAAPSLPARADRLAAVAGRVGGLAMIAVALALVAAGWGWVDARDLLGWPPARAALWRILSALLVLFLAAGLWAMVASWIDARLAQNIETGSGRSRTLLALFRNAFSIAVAVIALMVALSQLGLDIAPLLAGAGVVGLAVGFGSQKLVQDIITGIFIQLENAMDVGDVVGVAGVTGGVEKITIRSVRLRTMDGATHIIPFSAVDTVTNLTRDFGFHVAEITVGYEQDANEVKAGMQDAFERLRAEPLGRDVEGPLEMQGVVELRDTGMVVRARIRTRAGRQWDVGRRYNEILKEVLDALGVPIAVPSRTILLPAAAGRPPRRP